MWLLVFFLIQIFEFEEIGGEASFLSASATVDDIPVLASLNPSLQLKSQESGLVFTHTKPYGLSEIDYLKVSFRLKNLSLGGSVSGLISPGYGEWKFSLGKGFSLAPSFSFGLLFSLYYFFITNYEADFFFSLSPSLSFLRKEFLISLILLNSNQPQTRAAESLPLTFILGVGIPLQKGIDFHFDYEREREERVRAGLKILRKILAAGIGLATNPPQFTSGFALSLSSFQTSYGLKWHPQLKESHIINLGWKSSL
ncbi:MAG: hypothetical protein ABIK97_04255 [candidate division WOR-3 bacterium]